MKTHQQKYDLKEKEPLNCLQIKFEISIRALLFSILLLVFCMESWYQQHSPKNYWYFIFLIATSGVFFLILWVFDDWDLIEDMKDLALAEVVAQMLVSMCLISEQDSLPARYLACSATAHSLNNLFMTLYSARLLWPVWSRQEQAFYDWPVVGIFGWLAYKRRAAQKHLTSRWHHMVVYIFIATSLQITEALTFFVHAFTANRISIQEIAGFAVLLSVLLVFVVPAFFGIYRQYRMTHDALSQEQEKNLALGQANWRLKKNIFQSNKYRSDLRITPEKWDLLKAFDALHPDQQKAIQSQIKMLAEFFSGNK